MSASPTVSARRLVLSALALGALLLGTVINLPQGSWLISPGAVARVGRLPAAPTFRAGQRLLLLAPHPDDETLCCAGLIQQAQAAGAQVWVVWLTSGDGFEFDAALLTRTLDPTSASLIQLGELRRREAQAAARELGIPAAHLSFLGYPDGGLQRLFLEHYVLPYTSPATGADRVPYPGTRSPGRAYTGQNLEQDVGAAVAAVRPDLVYSPAPQDQHADHATTAYLALRVLAARGETDRLRYYVVHGGLEWPLPKGRHPSLPLTLPPRAPGLAWTRLDLTPDQIRRKGAAIRVYRTQTRVLGRFMAAFERRNELLSLTAVPLATPDRP